MQKSKDIEINDNMVPRHITVTGFVGDKKRTPAKKTKAGQGKLKAAQIKVLEAEKIFKDELDLAVKTFKEDVTEIISQT